MTYDIAPVLDFYEFEYSPDRDGNQKVRCVFHGDRNASASVRLGEGLFNCFTCEIAGDAIEVLKKVEGLDYVEAKHRAEELAGKSGRQVSREPDDGGTFLPRKQGHRPGRRGFVSPWSRKRS